MRHTPRLLALLATAALVSGCNGSGSFDDFFDRQGLGSEETYSAVVTSASFSGDPGDIQAVGAGTTESGNATVDLDLFGRLEGLEISGTTADNIDFDDDDANTTIDREDDFYEVEIDNIADGAVGRIADPDDMELSYHTYGAWYELDSGGEGQLVATVFGEPSNLADLSGLTSATYRGESTGVYANATTDQLLLTRSDMTADVNFVGGTIDFDTTNTTARSGFDGADMDMSGNLDASGNLTIAGTTFSGNITTTGGLTGEAQGLFAGDDAEELGGTLNAGDADESYVAGFGGDR